jgi:hypothetical protein
MNTARWSGARSSSTRSFSWSAAAAGPCTPSPRSPTPTSPAIRNGSPRSAWRDYFEAPGGEEAAAAVASCEEALARFESEALSAELDEPASDAGRASARSTGPTADKPSALFGLPLRLASPSGKLTSLAHASPPRTVPLTRPAAVGSYAS